MNYRRCHAVALIPEDRPIFSLQSVLAGGTGLAHAHRVVARAAHLDAAVPLEGAAISLLAQASAVDWQPLPVDPVQREAVEALLQVGLLIADAGPHADHRQADQVVRDGHWSVLSAVGHRHSRWADVDSALEMAERQLETADDLVRQLGAPPAEAPPRQQGAIVLPQMPNDAAAALLAQRVTCRNYDPTRSLPLATVAAILQQVLMAQAVVETEPGVRFLKKNVPSAGSLHPLEAYVLARGIEGLDAGLYHYHAVGHELALQPRQPNDLDDFAMRVLAGQHWFASAHVIILLACRFGRNFWKYRNHSKAYRAVTLDVGHVSQALYTAATRQGLGAFVTAAINEVDAEAVLQLQPMEEGLLAVCGFGWRATQQAMVELDPMGRVWAD